MVKIIADDTVNVIVREERVVIHVSEAGSRKGDKKPERRAPTVLLFSPAQADEFALQLIRGAAEVRANVKKAA